MELREYARKMEYEVVAEFTEKIQNLLFPSGILWDKEKGNYRTFDENKALLIKGRLSESYRNEKEENSFENSSSVNLCHIVPDYRTVVDDLLKILEFIDWLSDNHPEFIPLHAKSI